MKSKQDKGIARHFPRDSRGEFIAPNGLLTVEYHEANEAGCIQTEPGTIYFHGLLAATGWNPCDGCPEWVRRGPECKAFLLYHSSVGAIRDSIAQARVERSVRSVPRCPVCGGKVRGDNHDQGERHKKAMAAR